LERIHDEREVKDAYRWAREAGFGNVNLDLIYGLQGQTFEGWQTNLETALSLGPEHLSLYALTLEEGTPLTRDVERGRKLGPDLDLQADMFEWSREHMKQDGFHHYEVSNWAREGRECQHNLVYWHNGDWLGMGPGAHSHMFGERFADAASPRRYVELVNTTQPGEGLDGMRQVSMREGPDVAREMSETAFLALRLREGLDIAAWEARFGVDIMDAFGEAISETQSIGLTELVDGKLRLREEAVLLGDEAFLRFLEPAVSSNMI
jgi:oxygen-independent coproporphyrinogen-3 oxidase